MNDNGVCRTALATPGVLNINIYNTGIYKGNFSGAESLKVADLQRHNCGKCFRICAKLKMLNAKLEKLALFMFFSSQIYKVFQILHKFKAFLHKYMSLCKFVIRNFWLSKKIHF